MGPPRGPDFDEPAKSATEYASFADYMPLFNVTSSQYSGTQRATAQSGRARSLADLIPLQSANIKVFSHPDIPFFMFEVPTRSFCLSRSVPLRSSDNQRLFLTILWFKCRIRERLKNTFFAISLSLVPLASCSSLTFSSSKTRKNRETSLFRTWTARALVRHLTVMP